MITYCQPLGTPAEPNPDEVGEPHEILHIQDPIRVKVQLLAETEVPPSVFYTETDPEILYSLLLEDNQWLCSKLWTHLVSQSKEWNPLPGSQDPWELHWVCQEPEVKIIPAHRYLTVQLSDSSDQELLCLH